MRRCDVIFACAYGDLTMSSQSMPGRTTSSMYSPAPRMKRGVLLALDGVAHAPDFGRRLRLQGRFGCHLTLISDASSPAGAAARAIARRRALRYAIVSAATTGALSDALSVPAACWIALTMFT